MEYSKYIWPELFDKFEFESYGHALRNSKMKLFHRNGMKYRSASQSSQSHAKRFELPEEMKQPFLKNSMMCCIHWAGGKSG